MLRSLRQEAQMLKPSLNNLPCLEFFKRWKEYWWVWLRAQGLPDRRVSLSAAKLMKSRITWEMGF